MEVSPEAPLGRGDHTHSGEATPTAEEATPIPKLSHVPGRVLCGLDFINSSSWCCLFSELGKEHRHSSLIPLFMFERGKDVFKKPY